MKICNLSYLSEDLDAEDQSNVLGGTNITIDAAILHKLDAKKSTDPSKVIPLKKLLKDQVYTLEDDGYVIIDQHRLWQESQEAYKTGTIVLQYGMK
jgi:hypothetical protein